MVPCSFEESNTVLESAEHPEIDPISACLTSTQHGLPCIVSCWKLTKDEIDEFNRTGRIWLIALGSAMNPVNMSVFNPIEKR